MKGFKRVHKSATINTGIRTHIYQPTYTLVRSTYIALRSRSRSQPLFWTGTGTRPQKNPGLQPYFDHHTR